VPSEGLTVPGGPELHYSRYVKQPNAISRAAYSMPTMVRRLIFVAILNVQYYDTEMKTSFPLHDLAKQLGFRKTKRYSQLKNAVGIACKQVLRFTKENGEQTKWIPWLSLCELDEKTGTLTVHINEYLREYVADIRDTIGFSILYLADYIKLESRYAYRWFEIISSRSGHAGPDGHFYVRYSVPDIKKLFAIDGGRYGRMTDFRVNVIEKPLREIIDKMLGFHVFIEYVREGKELKGVILHCHFKKREDGNNSPSYYYSLYPSLYFKCLMEVKERLKAAGEDLDETRCMNEAVVLVRSRLKK
jgi:plasmid replication initiation protein